MPIAALLFIAGSAAAHAAWNIRLKGTGDPETAANLAVITPGLLAGALVLGAWGLGLVQITPAAALLGLAAGAAELAYFMKKKGCLGPKDRPRSGSERATSLSQSSSKYRRDVNQPVGRAFDGPSLEGGDVDCCGAQCCGP